MVLWKHRRILSRVVAITLIAGLIIIDQTRRIAMAASTGRGPRRSGIYLAYCAATIRIAPVLAQLQVQEPEALRPVEQNPRVTGGPADLTQVACPTVDDPIWGNVLVMVGGLLVLS